MRVEDFKCVIVFDLALTGHVTRRMRSDYELYSQGGQIETVISS